MQSSLFDRLKTQNIDEWERYCHHEFVDQLGSGELPQASFRHYLEQDYLFLIHFSRAWALAVYKSSNLDDMRAATRTLDALLNSEMKLHVEYCESFGISEAQLESTPEARANMAYTRFVLERGLAGDILDLHVALAPCVIGYAEIGQLLVDKYRQKIADNPYRDWINTYAGAEYQALANNARALLDRLAQVRATPERFDYLSETFRQATLLEVGFWDMGLHLEM